MTDVVAELDAELALIAELPYRVPIHHLARRARDEILALRRIVNGLTASGARAAALEEAAQLCERVPGDPKYGDFFAKAIRTLKDNRHE